VQHANTFVFNPCTTNGKYPTDTDTKRSMQSHKCHIVAAITYLGDHQIQKGGFIVVILCITATLSHTGGKAVRKVISMCGTPRFITQHINTGVQENSMHVAGSHLLCYLLNDITSRPCKLLVCIPAEKDCQDLLNPRCMQCHATVQS